MENLINKREVITEDNLNHTLAELEALINKNIKKNNFLSFLSAHEIYGYLAEEMKKIMDEIHEGDLDSLSQKLMDSAVIAFWGAACINQKLGKYGE